MKKLSVPYKVMPCLLLAVVAVNACAAGLPLDPVGQVREPFSLLLRPPEGEMAPGSVVQATIHIDIPLGHYLYKENLTVSVPVNGPFELTSFELPKAKKKFDKNLNRELEVYSESIDIPIKIAISEGAEAGSLQFAVEVQYQGCSDTLCYPPRKGVVVAEVTISEADMSIPAVPTSDQTVDDTKPAGYFDSTSPNLFDVEGTLEKRGLVGLVLIVFGLGVLMDFTPCVLPMIPVTIAAIGAKSHKSRLGGLTLSLFYVAGIVVTYSVIGIFASLVGGAANFTFTNPYVIGFMTVLFVALGLSMLGLYEIRVPSRLQSVLHVKNPRGFLGAFLVGLVAGIIATPCTTPVLAALFAFVAASRDPALGALLFGSLALGMGTLFIAIGTSWGVLKALPRAGDWMTVVKKFFGLMMFLVALWLLNIILPGIFSFGIPMILILAGILIGAFSGLKEGDGILPYLKKGFGIALFAGGLLLLGVVAFRHWQSAITAPETKVVIEPTDQKSIDWFVLGSDIIQVAESPGKPVMLFFTAKWCTYCSIMKRSTFTDRGVIAESTYFRTLEFDATKSANPDVQKVMGRYGITGLPTILFFDGNGSLINGAKIPGYIESDQMLEIMRAVRNFLEKANKKEAKESLG